jgi:hypothetical protein
MSDFDRRAMGQPIQPDDLEVAIQAVALEHRQR